MQCLALTLLLLSTPFFLHYSFVFAFGQNSVLNFNLIPISGRTLVSNFRYYFLEASEQHSEVAMDESSVSKGSLAWCICKSSQLLVALYGFRVFDIFESVFEVDVKSESKNLPVQQGIPRAFYTFP